VGRQLAGPVDAVQEARPVGAPTAHPGGTPDRRQAGGAAGPPPPTRSPSATTRRPNLARRGARGGRPPTFDRDRYKLRNQVGWLANRRHQFPAVATRYNKRAACCQATIMIA